MAKGLDFAFKPHPSTHAIKTYGAEWVGRYISSLPVNDTNGKNLLKAERDELLAAGIRIILFVEESAQSMKGGRVAGVIHAKHAVAVAKALGLDGIPFYYAADWDATPADQKAINAYMDGAISVHGLDRAGIYGGYYVVERTLDAGKAAFSCQTRAWSGGQWDHRANIRQGPTVTVGGASCDADESRTPDYGQWPRPHVLPPPGPAGPYRHTAPGGRTLAQIAADRNTTPAHILQVTADALTPADITTTANLNLPAGWVYYTTNA
jgi:Domain of unknown function (DUF1906)